MNSDFLKYFPNANLAELLPLLDDKKAWLNQPKKGFLRYRTPFQSICHLHASSCDFSGDVVTIGKKEDLKADQHTQLTEVLRGFMPWRKGPFSIFGIDIDAEWRSEKKWDRIIPHLPDLSGKTVADIGCNNGYYMFRMIDHAPAFVLGFEPYIHHYYAFQTLNSFARMQNLEVAPLGIEHILHFPDSFDAIFCLGILYHRPSPIQALRDLFTGLKKGGTIIIESQAIPGDIPIALFPEHTYAKVPGTWFVPTASCLHNWILRAGFGDIELFDNHPMSSKEQRSTDWMKFESYEDFIDKNNPTLTIEGYPAPRRIFFKATK